MKALAVIVLRFRQPEVERWKVPLNIRVRGIDIPIGLSMITVLLFLLAGINVLTKTKATIAGTIFTVVFFIAFTLSERYHKAKKEGQEEPATAGGDPHQREESEMEIFRLEVRENLSPKSLGVRPGNILVAIHDHNNLTHLEKVLDENNPSEADVVVLSINPDSPEFDSANPPTAEEVINACETKIFSKAVYVAEKAGKPAHLIAVPGRDVYELILVAASRLRSSRAVMSLSEKFDVEEQARQIAAAWEDLPRPRPELRIEIMPDGEEAPWKFELGRHLVLPSSADQDLAHRLLHLAGLGHDGELGLSLQQGAQGTAHDRVIVREDDGRLRGVILGVGDARNLAPDENGRPCRSPTPRSGPRASQAATLVAALPAGRAMAGARSAA